MSTSEQNNTKIVISVAALSLVLAAIIFLYRQTLEHASTTPTIETELPQIVAPTIDSQPKVAEPIIEAVETLEAPEVISETTIVAATKPLPPLHNSDEWFLSEVSQISPNNQPQLTLNNLDSISRIAVFLHNAANGNMSYSHLPAQSLKEDFSVIKQAGKIFINPDAYKRYDPFIDFITQIPPKQASGFYHLIEPLFSLALSEIGEHGEHQSQENLMDTVNILLATPVLPEKVELVNPKVMYQFVDEQFESLSAVQKQFVRMGPSNQLRLQSWLKEFKKMLNEADK